MQFARLKKAYTFVYMVVKSALFFLSIIDFFWDSYEWVSKWVKKINDKKVISTPIIEQHKPSYSIQ